MVIDVTTFNGEYDLFELRYQILKDVVDEFRVIEFAKTFSGRDKTRYIEESKNVFYDPIYQWPKVKAYYFTEKDYEKYREMAEQSPNTIGASHWKREFMQKECIKDALTDLDDKDIVFIGDCDEIWNPKLIDGVKMVIKDFTDPKRLFHNLDGWKCKQLVYTYFLNNLSSENWVGTYVNIWEYVKNECLNHLRSQKNPMVLPEMGWHFTSLADNLKQKLEDSYTEETYANQAVMTHLEENIKQNKDFLGRNFTYTTDESNWPTYLKENREKYKHLLK